MISYEEPTDESFEDFEVVDDYPGVILKGWHYDENLTQELEQECMDLAIVKNTGVTIQIFVKNETTSESERNIRVYAKPNVYPVHAVYSLIAEGVVDEEQNLRIYDSTLLIEEIHPMY